jgi:hypothetical protein
MEDAPKTDDELAQIKASVERERAVNSVLEHLAQIISESDDAPASPEPA